MLVRGASLKWTCQTDTGGITTKKEDEEEVGGIGGGLALSLTHLLFSLGWYLYSPFPLEGRGPGSFPIRKPGCTVLLQAIRDAGTGPTIATRWDGMASSIAHGHRQSF
ncbi:hypothetical protein ACLOJK_006185 [Asimina triloba]